MHPDFFCPGGWLLDGIEFVENMFCSHCDARVDTDVASCREVCETCELSSSEASSVYSDLDVAGNLESLLNKVLCLAADLHLSDQLQIALSAWLDRVSLHCSRALFGESPPQADHFWWQARVNRHCELMFASVYAELCNLDAQPLVLPAVSSSRADDPAYIDSPVSRNVTQSSTSLCSCDSDNESNKDWR